MKRVLRILLIGALLFAYRTAQPQPLHKGMPLGVAAQLALTKLYGSNDCSGHVETRIVGDHGRLTIKEEFALLNGNTRVEFASSQFRNRSLAPVDAFHYSLDRVTIFRPDLKLLYFVFPQARAFIVTLFPQTEAPPGNPEPKVEITMLTNEHVDGHPCSKRSVVISTGDLEKREFVLWFASDLRSFPIRSQFTNEGNIETATYRDIQFIKPDAKQFEPPSGFTACTNFQQIMERLAHAQVTGPPSTDAPDSPDERFHQLIEFTVRSGTDRSVSSNSAKAFGLGESPIPAKQIAVGSKDQPLVSIFGISARNSNDLFIAQMDRTAGSGTVWLTSPSGNIRGTILTSTNGPPKKVPSAERAEEFEAIVGALVEATTPAPGEDSPHPLNVASMFGQVSDVEAVLKRDPKAIDAQDSEGQTPLTCAIVQENEAVARFLLEQGADPEIPNKNGLTPLEQACSRSKVVAMSLAPLLLAKGALVNPTNITAFRIPPLEWAVTSDNVELVKLLLDHGANVKSSTDNGDTPLHTAADRGDLEIAEFLIAHGADVNAKIVGGTTPLHKAAWNGHAQIARLLLSKGAAVDPALATGVTPLLYAAGPGAERNGPDCFELLLSKGASLEVTNENGGTLLHSAAYYGNKAVVESLLAHGAKTNSRDKNGRSALQVATKPAIKEILRQHGAEDR